MQTFDHIIKDPQGLHARPAGLLVRIAKDFPCNISIKTEDKDIDAKHLLSVLRAGVECGQTVSFCFDGENEDEACAKILQFMDENL